MGVDRGRRQPRARGEAIVEHDPSARTAAAAAAAASAGDLVREQHRAWMRVQSVAGVGDGGELAVAVLSVAGLGDGLELRELGLGDLVAEGP